MEGAGGRGRNGAAAAGYGRLGRAVEPDDQARHPVGALGAGTTPSQRVESRLFGLTA